MAPPLGFIEPKDRTQEQADAHQRSLGKMVMNTLAPVTLAPGQKIILTKVFDDPDVIADMGMKFPGFRQLTGSCVGVTEGECSALLSGLQRKFATNPTRAFVPWWPYAYGRTRYHEGDRGQGEGAVSSVMGETLEKDGTFAATEAPELPHWNASDGLALLSSIEYQWSDGARIDPKYVALGQTHKHGARTVVTTTQEIITLNGNGYPVANGCAYFVGGGSVKGSGDTAYVRGRYDGRGGHETSFVGVWNHPNDGLLFLYWNHWNASTYPADPAGGPRCSVWVPESEVNRMLNAGWNGINQGEAFGISNVDYFPAQVDKIIDWSLVL